MEKQSDDTLDNEDPASSSPPPPGSVDSGGIHRRDVLKLAAAAGAATFLSPLLQSTARAGGPANGFFTEGQTDPYRFRDWQIDADWRFFRGDAAGAEASAFDDSGWRRLDLPHDWSVEDLPGAAPAGSGDATADPAIWALNPAPEQVGPFSQTASGGGIATGWTVGGVGWYRKHFPRVDLPKDTQVEIRFDGVYMNSDVWLNGVHLGFYPYGYTTFAYDLTPHLNPNGSNVLAVRVRNVGNNVRFYAGSGIYRHVWLTATGPVRIPLWGVAVTTPSISSGAATVQVDVTVENRETAASGALVKVRLLDPRGRQVAAGQLQKDLLPGAENQFPVPLALRNPNLWSPENPSLYQVEASVIMKGRIVDSTTTTFGVRSVEMDGNGLRINGRTIKLKGANVHSSNGALGAAAIDRAEERQVELLKACGYNSIRCAHNPPSPAFLDACDGLGILVIDEAFDVWAQPKNPDDYSQYFNDWWRTDLRSMVLRDRNHPSVIMWSIGNEIFECRTEAGVAYGHALYDYTRQLDPTRLVTGGGFMGAFSGYFPSDNSGPHWEFLDVADFHYYLSPYESAHAAHPDYPLLCSESFPSPPGERPPNISVYDSWKAVERLPYVIGDFVWTGIDYLGESGIGNVTLIPSDGPSQFGRPYPWFNAYCGDIDLIGEKKPQSYYRDVLWGLSHLEIAVKRPAPEGKTQAISFWGWFDELPSWTWPVAAGSLLTVRVYTDGDQVRLLLNGVEVGIKTLTDADKLVAQFDVPYAPGELVAIASRNGRVIAHKSLATVGSPARLRLRTDRSRLQRDRNDLAHVVAEVVDKAGRLVPDAVVTVKFHLDGAAELLAVANANPHNVDSFRQPRRKTFHGRCLAIIRPGNRRGPVFLRAESDGLAPGVLVLAVT